MNDRIKLFSIIILIISVFPVLLFSIREDVSGIWNLPEYIINNDIRVLSSDTLIIENGVSVKFNGNYQFEINGSLLVLGTEESKVQFKSYQEDEYWKGIMFCNYNSSIDSSYVHYAEIKNCLDQNGGGISVLEYSKLLIENSKIFDCSAAFGGGIYINYAHPTIRNTEICSNYASDSGGGIYSNHCNIVLDNIHVHNNESVNTAGGAFINYNRPMITNCIIEFNITQGNGGGMLVRNHYTGSEIRDCIIRNNSAVMRGGGYYNDDGRGYVYSSAFEENTSYLGGACFISNDGSFFTNCKFSNNNSEFGGAIYMSHVDSRFINCLFSYNQSNFGGAFYSTSHSSAKIINSNLVWNHAVYNGGGYLTIIDDGVEIYNSIFYYNNTDEIPGNQINIGSPTSETYIKFCNIQNGLDGISGHPEIMQPPLYENNINSPPLFADSLADFSLLTGSPCINVGTLNLPGGLELPEFDLAGNPRIYGDLVDMGAYEWQGVNIDNSQLSIDNFQLSNYPNPFNPSTTINFSTEQNEQYELSIYNIKGQKVKTFSNLQISQSPNHQITWNGTDQTGKPVSSGIYFVRLKAGEIEASCKMLLLK
ncbi:MAG: T9SS type A sorting domain-containing protein [Candidatus Cloacimonadales bacterium]|nr:T9SS type A sorting domain-containing protein [Candidatus Cloacimonadales bacterium]